MRSSECVRYMCNGKDATQCKAQNINTEACDNVDNDCDGKVDEDTSQGSCQIMKGTCVSRGKWTCMMGASICDAPAVGADYEICGNGKDDDCDSKIDEDETGTGQPYPPAWFLDCELNDGVGNATIATNSCSKPPDVNGCHFVSRSGSENTPAGMCHCP